jgi:hypothetical protein
MLNPIRLVNDLFDTHELSNANLRGFSDNFLIRLALNNPGGIYTGLITDTTTKYTNFYGKITNQSVKDAISQGLTIATNNSKATVLEEMGRLQNLIRYRFGATSPTYQEFYPHGMDEYHQAKIDDIGTILDRFAEAAVAHLTATERADVITFIANFKAARTAQVTVIAEVDILGTGKHVDRKALTMQLTVDFLTIASNNVDDEDAFDDYFDPRFLPLSDADHSVLREGEINSGQILAIDTDGLVIAAGTDLLLENNTNSTIRYFFTNAPGNGPTGSYVDVEPNDSKAIKCSEISFSAANPVLSAYNIGPVTGKFRVRIFQ